MHNQLLLHGGGYNVTRHDLANVTTPDPVNGWLPLPHILLADEVERQLASHTESGPYGITSKEYALSNGGQRFFGMYHLTDPSDTGPHARGISIGVRNSHDKRFSASIAMGHQVMCCSNLAFWGEAVLARKHTRNILRDLPGLVHGCLGGFAEKTQSMERDIEKMRRWEPYPSQQDEFLMDCVRARVFAPSKLPKILGIDTSRYEDRSFREMKLVSLWGLFNAVTEVMRDTKSFPEPRKTMALHGIAKAIMMRYDHVPRWEGTERYNQFLEAVGIKRRESI